MTTTDPDTIDDPYWTDAEDFLAARADFAEIMVVTTDHDTHAVVLKVDGYYTDARDAEDMARWFAAGLRPLLERARPFWDRDGERTRP